MVRSRGALAAWAFTALLPACGSGSDGGESAGAQARLEIGPAGAQAESLPSGSLQTRMLELRNSGTARASDLSVTLKPDGNLLHLPLSCEGVQAQRCKTRADGGIDVAELPAGMAISLSQRLRVKPGFSGDVSNDWSLISPGGGGSNWRQILQAYVADVSVAVQPPVASTESGVAVLSYEVVLRNAGPDEARHVEWRQLAAPGMTWRGATCSAAGGAVCPATLGEKLTIARLPKGSTLRLQARYTSRVAGPRVKDFLGSEVGSPGDPFPGNDRVTAKEPDAWSVDGNYLATDLEGNRYTLSVSPVWKDKGFRLANDRFDVQGAIDVDVTGSHHFQLGEQDGSTLLRDGSIQLNSDLLVGSFNFGRGRQPFVAVRDIVQDLSELEGRAFTVLGSRSDKDGRPIDAFVWSGQFKDAALLVCQSDTPIAISQCLPSQARRYEVALVGTELELLSSTGVLRMRAARTKSGPVLLLSQRDADTGGSQFWIGLPVVAPRYRPSLWMGGPGITETTFNSAAGLAEATGVAIFVSPDARSASINHDMPNSYLVFVARGNPTCFIDAAADATTLPSLFKGVLSMIAVNGASCTGGPIYHAQTGEIAVVLGAKDGPLMGRWLITTE